MALSEPTDTRKRNKLILALKRAIEARLDHAQWKELGYATDTADWISTHPRLLRSLSWGDPDYGGHVLDAIEVMLSRDPANLQVLLDFDGLAEWIRDNDPAVYAEVLGGDLPALATIADAERLPPGFDVNAQTRRIREALANDPALALGSTKELLETVLKTVLETVLGLHGAEIGPDDMPRLLKRAQAGLGLDPKDVDDATPGAESFRRLLGALTQVVISITELRNLYGTGHGRSNAPGLDLPSARLMVTAGTGLATYLMERYAALKAEGSAAD